MPSQPFGQALPSFVIIHLSDRQGVVTGNLIVRKKYVRLRCASQLVLKSEADEESSEGLASAVKPVDIVMPRKLFNAE